MTSDVDVPENYIELLQQSNFPLYYQQAETAIKVVDHEHIDLGIPAINELRYAGYHLALFIKDPKNKVDEIRKACGHCQRATYDAYEASIIYCIEEYKTFQRDYKDSVIPDVIPDYVEKIKIIKHAIRFIDSIDKETKAQNYEKCKEYHEALINLVESLNEARPELNKKIKAERRNAQLLWGSLILGIAVLIATLVFGVVQLRNDNDKKNGEINTPTRIEQKSKV
jgi:hypothetical protein